MQKINTFEIVRLIDKIPQNLLSSTEHHLLTKMALLADKEGKNIKIRISKLAKLTRFCDKTIRNNLKLLIDKRFLISARKPKNGSWEPTLCELNIDELLKHKSSTTPVIDSITPVTTSTNPGNGYRGNNKTHISTYLNLNNIVELASNSTSQLVDLKDLYFSKNKEEIDTLLSRSYPKIDQISSLDDFFKNLAPEYGKGQKNACNGKILDPEKGDKQINKWSSMVTTVFDYWKTSLNHSRAKLDTKRYSLIVNAFKLGFNVDDLKKTIDGVSKTPHNMGNNDRGEIYDGLHVIFRNAEQIERFMRNADNPPISKLQNKSQNNNKTETFSQKNDRMLKDKRDFGMKYFPDIEKHFPGNNFYGP